MKNHLKLTVTVFSLLFVFCTSSKQIQKPKTEGRLNDPSRTYEIVKQGVATIFPKLTMLLGKIPALYSQHDTVSIKMYINPSGSIDLIGFADSIKLDPGIETGLDFLLFSQVIDSSYKTRTVTKVVVHSYLDANNMVTLSENIDIEYVDIRSRDDILLIINMNKGVLGKAYSRRWAEKQGLEGTITVRFGIDENGVVVFCKVIESTMHDSVMEQAVVDTVKKWLFGKINNPGDVTEVVYPFKFNQE